MEGRRVLIDCIVEGGDVGGVQAREEASFLNQAEGDDRDLGSSVHVEVEHDAPQLPSYNQRRLQVL